LARRRRFARKEVVFHKDDPGDTIHLIASGHVAVRNTPRAQAIIRARDAGLGT